MGEWLWNLPRVAQEILVVVVFDDDFYGEHLQFNQATNFFGVGDERGLRREKVTTDGQLLI